MQRKVQTIAFSGILYSDPARLHSYVALADRRKTLVATDRGRVQLPANQAAAS